MGVDPSFPIHLLGQLIPQAVLTSNLLQQLNVVPKVLTYAFMNGTFEYNVMPIASLVCAIQANEVINQ